MFAIVDDADFLKLSGHSWCVIGGVAPYHYAGRRLNGKIVKMHRIIAKAKTGQFVDHINGDTLDDRKSNLRILKRRGDNTMNSKLRSDNVSGFKGVQFRKDRGHYRATIRHQGRLIYIGSSSDAKIAARMYNKKAVDLFGEYARLNKI